MSNNLHVLKMQILNKYKAALSASILFISFGTAAQPFSTKYKILEEGIVRNITGSRDIALIFTADEWFEGYGTVLNHLREKSIKGGFFLTGRMFRNPTALRHIRECVKAGHYMGPHSDMHLLYNDWTRRDSLLVTKDSMQTDLLRNVQAMHALGIRPRKQLFIPPYEWWNRIVAGWSRELGWQIFSFTPGTFTNADYTTPDMGDHYRSTDTLLQRLFRKESAEGLAGAIILIHLGTDPRRTDKLYDRLPLLIDTLSSRGYRFVRIDQLLAAPEAINKRGGRSFLPPLHY